MRDRIADEPIKWPGHRRRLRLKDYVEFENMANSLVGHCEDRNAIDLVIVAMVEAMADFIEAELAKPDGP